MGNTEMTKYMAAGAFADLTADKSKFPNSSTWLKGLQESATYDGKLMGVPYYAGSRVVIYRTDLFKKAGVKGTPTSLAQFVADGKKLMNANSGDKSFSAFYVAGKDWYSAHGLRLRLRRPDRHGLQRQAGRARSTSPGRSRA